MIPILINLNICVLVHDVRKTKIKFRFVQNFIPQLQLLAEAGKLSENIFI